jgi:hypothetical protein
MLRKVIWSAVYGAIAAVTTIASRRAAAQLWRSFTGEDPPTKK